MSRGHLLLPVETANRELDGKLLMALEAAGRGWDTVVGQRNVLDASLGRFPRSVYFAKGFRSANARKFRMITGLGHKIVALDEEGLVTVSDRMWLARADSDALRQISLVFTWGPDGARLTRAARNIGETPVISTGNPRVDLLRPELGDLHAPEVERIRSRYGRFALLNTNFSPVNPYAGRTRFRVARAVPRETAEDLKTGWFGHKARLLDGFLDLLPALADALRPRPLVVRPHPSENAATWRDAAQDLDNVHVVYEGSVAPWLAASEVLIHNGCTTAIEASILGTPALAYRPVKQAGFDNELPNGLSREYEDADALIAAAVDCLRSRGNGAWALDPARQNLLRRHVSALDGPLACTRLVDEIERHAEMPPMPPVGRRLTAGVRLGVRWTKQAVRRRSGRRRGKPSHSAHRFPPLGVDEVTERISRLSAALGGVGDVEAEELAPDLFRIARRAAAPGTDP